MNNRRENGITLNGKKGTTYRVILEQDGNCAAVSQEYANFTDAALHLDCLTCGVLGEALYDMHFFVTRYLNENAVEDYEHDRALEVFESEKKKEDSLIAAAPELLEALENLERAQAGEIIWPEDLNWEDTINRARKNAKAAIAKAKGENES